MRFGERCKLKDFGKNAIQMQENSVQFETFF